MTDEPVTHYPTVTKLPDKTLVDCTCGASWSHPASATEDTIASIFKSHVTYFDRPKTKVD